MPLVKKILKCFFFHKNSFCIIFFIPSVFYVWWYRTMRLIRIVWQLNQLPDEEILTNCSTSPSAEGPDFIDNERRLVILQASIGSHTQTHRDGSYSPLCFQDLGLFTKVSRLEQNFPKEATTCVWKDSQRPMEQMLTFSPKIWPETTVTVSTFMLVG